VAYRLNSRDHPAQLLTASVLNAIIKTSMAKTTKQKKCPKGKIYNPKTKNCIKDNAANRARVSRLLAGEDATGRKQTQFVKGQSGNPKGPKPGTRKLATTLKLAMENLAKAGKEKGIDLDDIDLVITTKWLEKAARGDMRAIDMYISRMHGKQVQPIALGDVGEDAIADKLAEEEAAKEVMQMQQQWQISNVKVHDADTKTTDTSTS
jgi:hypothetical protein